MILRGRHLLTYVLMSALWAFIAYQGFAIFVLDRKFPTVVVAQSFAYDTVEADGTLQLQTTLIRKRPCAADITQYISDSKNVRFDLPTAHVPVITTLGLDTFKRSINVPASIAPGPATYSLSVRYTCDWSHLIWPLIRDMHEFKFNVVQPKG